jgi:hypothetical protein
MANMYYSQEEVLQKLGCTEDQLREMVRSGKLREFRDAGKMTYQREEVDKLAGGTAGKEDTGELSLDDSSEIPFAQESEQQEQTPVGQGGDTGFGSGELSLEDSGSGSGEIKLEDSGSGSGEIKLEDTGESEIGELDLEDSGSAAGELSLSDSGTDEVKLEDSGAEQAEQPTKPEKSDQSGESGSDVLSLDEVDKDAASEAKKDDTVITNIGISVFDDDDLEISADPMAKTMITQEDDQAMDGSGSGSGLLDLTRESDDTSLGAELLEGIDMGDTQDAMAPASEDTVPETAAAEEEGAAVAVPEAGQAPGAATAPVSQPTSVVEAVSPAFTGLLVAASLSLALAGSLSIANAQGILPGYLVLLAEKFWIFLGATVAMGGVFALVGWLVGQQATSARQPKSKEKKAKKEKPKKTQKPKKAKKAKKGK